jgi:hypothetical protein
VPRGVFLTNDSKGKEIRRPVQSRLVFPGKVHSVQETWCAKSPSAAVAKAETSHARATPSKAETNHASASTISVTVGTQVISAM